VQIKYLKLHNFRKFADLEIEFDEQLTVLTARNGQGKTTILEAICAAFGTFVGAFDLGKAKGIDLSDARKVRLTTSPQSEWQFPVQITAKAASIEEGWRRELTGPKNNTTVKNAHPITDIGKLLQQELRKDSEIELPFIAYYSTARLWKNAYKKQQRPSKLDESRTKGYEDCFALSTNFTEFQLWMKMATLAVLQQQQTPGYDCNGLDSQLEGIQEAVNKVLSLEGWENFHYSITYDELVMFNEEQGFLPIAMLSDGVRAMIAMVADIAFRCCLLNSHYGKEAPIITKGIALIDEVDLHLHPEWQQKVVSQLQTAFPSLQLILTTHSPQVLSTVKRKNIRVLDKSSDRDTAEPPLAQSYGEESQNVLHEIMGVDPQPPLPEKKDLQELTYLVDTGAYESKRARVLFEELEATLTEEHPQLKRLKRSIKRQEVLKK